MFVSPAGVIAYVAKTKARESIRVEDGKTIEIASLAREAETTVDLPQGAMTVQ